MMKRSSMCIAVLGLLFSGSVGRAATIAVGINLNANPDFTTHAATEIGWVYVPSSTFALSGVSAAFSSVDGRTVTAELHSVPASPNGNTPSEVVGPLLRSATFTASTSISSTTPQAVFVPITLQAGTEYFFGFRNVQGLGHLTTNDGNAQHLGTPASAERVFYDSITPPPGTYSIIEDGTSGSAPILALYSPSPEPATLTLFGIGAFGLVGYRWLRRKQTA